MKDFGQTKKKVKKERKFKKKFKNVPKKRKMFSFGSLANLAKVALASCYELLQSWGFLHLSLSS
jgi:hypothetical protein